MIILPAKFNEASGYEISVVEATGADMLIDGGERNDADFTIDNGQDTICELGERPREGTDGVVFEIMNEATEDGLAFANNESRWKIGTIWADAGRGDGFAIWANIFMVHYYVIFTTFA